jgi:hypothetical protein
MKAAVYTCFKGPLQIDRVADPEPTTTGRGDRRLP